MRRLHRRRFLTGVGGAVVALPFLESVVFPGGTQAKAARPVYSLFFKQGCGVAQATGGEPERFWPNEVGTLTTDILRNRDADRAVSELADYASQLIVLSGTDYGFYSDRCGHAGGSVQTLTAAQPVVPDGLSGHASVATGESIDWRVGRECNQPGVEPIYFQSGRVDDYFAGPSYSAPHTPRAAQNNPLAIYVDIMGLSGLEADIAMRIAQRRTSVNDLVREQMRDLLGSADLGSADRTRLQTHFEAIRDTELTMACELGGADVTSMMDIESAVEDNGTRIAVTEIMMSLAAFVFSCDINRSVVVQMAGKASDSTRYMVDGVLQNEYHRISHRIDSDGDMGDPIPDADRLHHEIDRIHARIFRHLLDRLSMYAGPTGGTLLDDCVVAWCNELSSGPPHGTTNLPWVLAGSAGGFLRTGQYIDAGGITHNKLLNTILSAHGLTNEDGGYFDSFGDPSLERGVIDAMIA